MSLLPPQRHLFDIPDDIAYFNCAYNAPQLNESQRRLLDGVRGKSHPWERTAQSFFEDAETIRRLSADIFGGDAEGYAVVPAASYGLSAAATYWWWMRRRLWGRCPSLRPRLRIARSKGDLKSRHIILPPFSKGGSDFVYDLLHEENDMRLPTGSDVYRT